MIVLSDAEVIARGGKREIFSHPGFSDRCIKVWLRGQEPETLYRKQHWSRKIRKRVSSFDENNNDRKVLERLDSLNPPSVWDHVPRYHGVVDTDRGPGVVVEKLCDFDGSLSKAFEDRLQEDGYTHDYERAVGEFGEFWLAHRVPSRELMVYNLVMQEPQPGQFKLYIVDGFGSRQFLPLDKVWKGSADRQRKKLRKLDQTIQHCLQKFSQ